MGFAGVLTAIQQLLGMGGGDVAASYTFSDGVIIDVPERNFRADVPERNTPIDVPTR